MRATKHAPRNPFNVLERSYGLADIVERRAVVLVERLSVIPPQLEREFVLSSVNASRHGDHFTQQCLGFFEALEIHKGVRVVVGGHEAVHMSFAKELQSSEVYFSLHPRCMFISSKTCIRAREIALRDEDAFFSCAKAPQHRQLGILHGQRVLVMFCNG